MAGPPIDPAETPPAPAAAKTPAITPKQLATGSIVPAGAARPPRTFSQKLMRAVDDAFARASTREDGRLRKRVFYPIYALRVLLQVIRQWARDRCPQQAQALAFQSALSIVPLVAIALILLRAFGAFGAQSALVDVLSRQVLPVSREVIAEKLVGWADNMANFGTAGIAGFVSMLVLSFFMFDNVERIFNDIWRAPERRSLQQRLVVFYALVTIVPSLMGFSLYHAARFGLTDGAIGALGALGATFAALVCANKLLPTAKVAWGPAAIGALFSALAFEVAKHLFGLYVSRVAFQKYSGVYGTLGLLPVVLIWIYYSWLVVLLGAEIAHAVQNLRHLERLDRRTRRAHSAEEALDKVNGTVAVRLFAAVVESWRGGRALSRGALAARFDLDEDVVEKIFRRLRDRHLVVEVDGDTEGFLPARHPGEIQVTEVLAAFRGADIVSTSLRSSARNRLDELLTDLELAARDKARGVTMDDVTR